jgi:NAD-dependent DNA ligase
MMALSSDDDQQAAIAHAQFHRQDTKAIQTLMGICSGLIADKEINDHEIAYLTTWLTEHVHIQDQWPACAIYYRIKEITADGIITPDERDHLLARLEELTGNFFSETGAAAIEGPALPFDDDPSIYFRNMSYCFTGEFMFGTRASCERTILRLGAMPQDRVTKNLNYLVIGSRCSPNWISESFGRKIKQAVEYRDSGTEICIITEKQWTLAIQDADR